jgi:hypothetical protein
LELIANYFFLYQSTKNNINLIKELIYNERII